MDLLCICLHGKNLEWCSLVQNGQYYKVQIFSLQATVQKVTTNYVLWKRISSKWLCIKIVTYFYKDKVKIKYHCISPSVFLEEEKCSILKKILLLYEAKMLLRLNDSHTPTESRQFTEKSLHWKYSWRGRGNNQSSNTL